MCKLSWQKIIQPPIQDTNRDRRYLWIETGVVVILTATPALDWLVSWLLWGTDFLQFYRGSTLLSGGTATNFAIHEMYSIFYYLRFVVVVLFIM